MPRELGLGPITELTATLNIECGATSLWWLLARRGYPVTYHCGNWSARTEPRGSVGPTTASSCPNLPFCRIYIHSLHQRPRSLFRVIPPPSVHPTIWLMRIVLLTWTTPIFGYFAWHLHAGSFGHCRDWRYFMFSSCGKLPVKSDLRYSWFPPRKQRGDYIVAESRTSTSSFPPTNTIRALPDDHLSRRFPCCDRHRSRLPSCCRSNYIS